MTSNQTFIFVHGAWHAAWCWERVANALCLHGHSVITPDLPGHGTNHHPTHLVTFNKYVAHLTDLIKQQNTPVTLVGHSMAGLIIAEVAELIPHHIKELVFVAAYIPKHQQSLLSIAETSASREVSPHLIIDQKQKTLHLRNVPDIKNIFFNCCETQDAVLAQNKLQAQPLQPFTHQVSLGKHFANVAKKSLVSSQDRAIYAADQLLMSKQVTDNIIHLDADHAVYYSNPYGIIDALLR